MKNLVALTLLAVLPTGMAQATAPALPTLNYRTGTVRLLDDQATLVTGPTLRYLDAADARRVIVDLWGNPPEAAEDVTGMIVPVGADLTADQGWGVVVTRDEDGHVSDSDAAGMNYDQIMRDMQAATREHNAEREKAGFDSADLVGWADPPRYDAATHKMYWAKELNFHRQGEPDGEHTLNYAVRVLGRDNVMELNAVGGMNQLPQIRQGMQSVLTQVSFDPGHRYEDFNANTDKLATYGIAGLLGVAAAKKIGLLAGGLLLLKKGGVLLLGAFGALARLFRRRSGPA